MHLTERFFFGEIFFEGDDTTFVEEIEADYLGNLNKIVEVHNKNGPYDRYSINDPFVVYEEKDRYRVNSVILFGNQSLVNISIGYLDNDTLEEFLEEVEVSIEEINDGESNLNNSLPNFGFPDSYESLAYVIVTEKTFFGFFSRSTWQN
ncbi:hypothetical protein [Streptococcus parauberis]|uniref:hypothetical protein n=1 Tax=Streptococcus parauberis TaxID=1348 RepID=UPI000CCEFE5B|nr:hypothetical protein [Streptococcus parauberis]PNY18931.1 hypothetical protein ASN86_00788 [Streptococcus parauberis]